MKSLSLAALMACLLVQGQTPEPARPKPDDSAESLESLLAVKVVTATRIAEAAAGAPGMMHVITRDELDRFGGRTLREALGRVAGLDLGTSNFTDRNILAARGDKGKATSAHILFLINGRPTREVLEGGVMSDLLEAFPIESLERIEIIEGPGSALYGSNAFSGVINLITRKILGRSFSARGFSGPGAAAMGGTASVAFQKKDFRILGAAQFQQSNGSAAPYAFGAAASAPWFPLYSNSRGAYAEVGYKGFSGMVATTLWRAPYDIGGGIGENHWRRTFADFGYDRRLRGNWDMGVHVSYTQTALQSSVLPVIDRKARETEVDWTNSITLNERAQVAFGTNLNHQAGRELLALGPVSLTSTDATRSGGGFFGQLQYKLVDGLKLVGGFQTNKIGDLPMHTVPRLGAIWTPAEHWHVKALYGQAFRAPSLNETHIQNIFIGGNRNLLPELATTFDLGVTYQNSHLQTTVNYFRTRQSNAILVAVSGTGNEIVQYQNIGRLLFQGGQWEAKWYLTRQWLVEGSMMYVKNQQSDDSPRTRPATSIGAKGGLSYSDKRGWTFSVFDIYTGMPKGYETVLNPHTPARHLVTAHARLRLEKYFGPVAQSLALFAHGDNLANQRLWQPVWGEVTRTTLPVSRGATVYFGLEFSARKE